MWNRGPFMTSFSKIFQSSFKVIYRDQTPTETSTLLAICIFKRSNPILYLIFQNSGKFISAVTSLSLHWVKRAQSCISCVEGDRKIKINISRNFEVRNLFLNCLYHFLKVLYLWLQWWRHYTKIGSNSA